MERVKFMHYPWYELMVSDNILISLVPIQKEKKLKSLKKVYKNHMVWLIVTQNATAL